MLAVMFTALSLEGFPSVSATQQALRTFDYESARMWGHDDNV
jgi:hypothetical protein